MSADRGQAAFAEYLIASIEAMRLVLQTKSLIRGACYHIGHPFIVSFHDDF